MKKIFGLLFLFIFIIFGLSLHSETVDAVGGSNGECEDADVVGHATGTGDEKSYTDSSGGIVTGVCIKAGNTPFGDGHSDALVNGSYDYMGNVVIENPCYTITGVGTSTVTVVRHQDTSSCQEISHIDIYIAPVGTPTPTTEPEIPTNTPYIEPTDEPAPTDEPTSTPFPTEDITPAPTGFPFCGQFPTCGSFGMCTFKMPHYCFPMCRCTVPCWPTCPTKTPTSTSVPTNTPAPTEIPTNTPTQMPTYTPTPRPTCPPMPICLRFRMCTPLYPIGCCAPVDNSCWTTCGSQCSRTNISVTNVNYAQVCQSNMSLNNTGNNIAVGNMSCLNMCGTECCSEGGTAITTGRAFSTSYQSVFGNINNTEITLTD